MIQFVLERNGAQTVLYGDAECPVERVRDFQKGGCKQCILYVTDHDLDAAERRQVEDAVGFAVIRVVGLNDNCTDVANDALLEIERWDSLLVEALLQGATFSTFTAIGWEMLKYPFAYIDRNLITLTASDGYWDRDGYRDDSAYQLHVEGQMPFGLATDLVEDIDYLNAAQEHGIFYYESASQGTFLGLNTYDNGEYLARLVVRLPGGAKRLPRGAELLVEHYHERLVELHARYAGNAEIAASQNDALHHLVRQALLHQSPIVLEDVSNTLLPFDWHLDDDFSIAKIVFFEEVHWDNISLYLCGMLEQVMPGSCAFPLERNIVWMVDFARAAGLHEGDEDQPRRMLDALVSVLRNYACKAGISDVFSNFAAAPQHFVAADCALELGEKRSPHYWYYRFGDYAFDYLLSKCTEELDGEITCHPGLIRLLEHDACHGTDLAHTLVCFLRNNQNTTRTANELFIHRTSLTRRMSQIKSIGIFDLDNSDEVLHLLISAKTLAL